MSDDFRRDNEWQLWMRNRLLAPFYGELAIDGRFVFLDGGRFATDIAQRQLAVDTIVQLAGGRVVAIEEKIVRWKGVVYPAYCLETESCTVPGHEKPGWMCYAESDILLYCFQTEAGDLDAHFLDFPRLRTWFERRNHEFRTFGPLNTLNRSTGRLAPIDAVASAGLVVSRATITDPARHPSDQVALRAAAEAVLVNLASAEEDDRSLKRLLKP